MGFRFRKSINLGGGFKVNLSKSGVGYSWGTKGVRFTKTAKGKNRTTLNIPGTGISHVTESGGNKKNQKSQPTKQKPANTTGNSSSPNPNNGNGGKGMAWVKFIICLFFGCLGIHKFMEKRIGMGILYLFTLGLFGFGWIVDCVKYLIAAVKSTTAISENAVPTGGSYAETATQYPPVEIPAKRRFSVKKILLWVLTVFLALIAIAFLPHISGVIALAAAVIAAPIEKWQAVVSRFVKGKVKAIIVTVMTLAAFFAVPTTETPDTEPPSSTVMVAESTEATETTTEAVTESSTELPTELATEPQTELVTESVTEPVTELVTEAVTEPVTEPITETIPELAVEQVTELPTEQVSEQVSMPAVDVENVSFDEELYCVGIGRTVNVPFMLYPENANNDTLEVSINNTKIATVSLEKKDDGVIQIAGLASGTATITLKAGDAIVAKKEITVTEVLPEIITIETETKTPLIGDKGTFSVVYAPADVTTQKVTWKSSAPNVLKVNADGTYQAVSVGNATITATHAKGVIGTFEIEVLPIEVESIALTSSWDTTKAFYRNNTMTLKAEVLPQNATDRKIIWTSSDESIITVSDKGVVKAISAGTATITATAANGQQSKYEITVELSPQKFRVSTSISMKSNDHVGNKWTTGFEFNGEKITNGSIVSILPGDTFSAYGWAQDNDSNPDYGHYGDKLPLTAEMCNTGFTIEGEADVRENGGRYSGHYATWYVKMIFTPVN